MNFIVLSAVIFHVSVLNELPLFIKMPQGFAIHNFLPGLRKLLNCVSSVTIRDCCDTVTSLLDQRFTL